MNIFNAHLSTLIPFCGNVEHRTELEETYGLIRDELRYTLRVDPKDVHGADFPGKTFRVLKDKEERLYGEYRTSRLVLGAWDKIVSGGLP